MKKDIVFIGAGNVATHIAKELYKKGYNILQIYSRTEESAKMLAVQVNSTSTTDTKAINQKADFYIFSLKDDVLKNVIDNISPNNSIWLHTSGSMPISVFENKIKNFGVIYPLQTFSKHRDIEWQNIPLFLEASDHKNYATIEKLATDLSDKRYPLASDKRRFIHLSGVFACNFVNHMYNLANEVIKKADLPFEILLPLIDETAQKVHELNPHDAQTGPAIRYDENIINKHLNLLEKDPEVKNIYKILSENISKRHKTDK